MPRAVTSPLQIARHVLAQANGWFLFVEVPSVLSPGAFYRLVRNTHPIAANGVTWQAANVEITLPEENASGDLGDLKISLPNESRLPIALIEAGDILGQQIRVFLQPTEAFAAFVPDLSWVHTAVRANATDAAVTVECGHPAELLRVPFPVFDRRRFKQLLRTAQ